MPSVVQLNKLLATSKHKLPCKQYCMITPEVECGGQDSGNSFVRSLTSAAFCREGVDALNNFVSAVQGQRSEVLHEMRKRSEELLFHSTSLFSSASVEEMHHHLTEIVNLGGPEVSGAWAAAKVGIGIASLSAGHVAVGCCVLAFALGSLGSSVMWGAYRESIRSGERNDTFLLKWLPELRRNFLTGNVMAPSQHQKSVNQRALSAVAGDNWELKGNTNNFPRSYANGEPHRSMRRHSPSKSIESCKQLKDRCSAMKQPLFRDAWEDISETTRIAPEERNRRRIFHDTMPVQGSMQQLIRTAKRKDC